MNHPSALKRYPECFEITSVVINRLTDWIDKGDLEAPKDATSVVLFAIAVRSFNLYRSINNLLKTDHWEDAGILSRSMYELVLNLEEVQREEGKEESKAKKYMRFHMLQEFLHMKLMSDYHYKTGRASNEEQSGIIKLERDAKKLFAEFKSKRGHLEWQNSWCGKSVYKLAKESTNNMRMSHYEISYSYFSSLSHSGPTPVMAQMIMGETDKETEKLMEKQLNKEKESLMLVMSLSTVWLIEIIMRCKSVIPAYDVGWNLEITQKIRALYGA